MSLFRYGLPAEFELMSILAQKVNQTLNSGRSDQFQMQALCLVTGR